MSRIRSVIVENEQLHREDLVRSLSSYCPQIELVGTADTVESSIRLIQEQNPKIVFLDVELPDGTGFDILKTLQPIDFKVVFYTSFSDYALQAFRFHAVDYLVKPIIIHQLVDAVKRAERQIQDDLYRLRIEGIGRQYFSPNHLVIPVERECHVIKLNNIIKIEAVKGKESCILYYTGKHEYTCKKLLKDLEKFLQGKNHFFRCHNSFIINLEHVISFSRHGNTKLIKLSEGLTATLGGTYEDDFFNNFPGLPK